MSDKPKHFVIDNLHFTDDGVWAYWIIDPLVHTLTATPQNVAAINAHRELAQLAQYQPSITCTSSLYNPETLNQMQHGHAAAGRHKVYDLAVKQRTDALLADAARTPIYWLWIKLRPTILAPTMTHQVTQFLAERRLYTATPTHKNIEKYRSIRDIIRDNIPELFNPTPAAPQQIFWFWKRHYTLGSTDEPCPPSSLRLQNNSGFTYTPKINATESAGKKNKFWKPGLAVQVNDEQTSYQIHALVAGMPDEGIVFPSSIFTNRAKRIVDDTTGQRVAVDITQHLKQSSLNKTHRNNNAAFKKINDQFEQQAGRRSTLELEQAQATLSQYEQELSSGVRETEIEVTTVFSIGATSHDKAHTEYNELRAELETLKVELQAIPGIQTKIWESNRPGKFLEEPGKCFTQFMSRTGWSQHLPINSQRFGDPAGLFIGCNRADPDLSPVMVNTRGRQRTQGLGGWVLGGDPGGGKTHLAMLIAALEAASGACVLAIDATADKQWSTFGASVPDERPLSSRILNLAAHPRAADALSCGLDHPRTRVAAMFTDIVGVDMKSPDAARIRDICSTTPAATAAGIIAAMSTNQDPHIRQWAATLRSWSSTVAGRALLGHPDHNAADPPFTLAVSPGLTVIDISEIGLPSATQLTAAAQPGGRPLTETHIMAQLLIENISVKLRDISYTDKETRTILILDEGWRIAQSPILSDLILDILRTGRSANTDLIVLTQKPWNDFQNIDDDLLHVRAVFPVKSKDAGKAIEWLGGGDDDAWAAQLLTVGSTPETKTTQTFFNPSHTDSHTVTRHGECLMRIGASEIGYTQILPMPFEEWAHAADTRPPR